MLVQLDERERNVMFEGAGDEQEIVEIIQKHLLTPEHKAVLEQHSLNVYDVLNGRFGNAARTTEVGLFVTDILFPDWNGKLGQQVFGF